MNRLTVLLPFVVATAAWNPQAGGYANINGLGTGFNFGMDPFGFNSFTQATNNVMKNFAQSFNNVMNGFNSNMFRIPGNNFGFGSNIPGFGFNFDYSKLPVNSETVSISTDKNGMKIDAIGSVASTSISTGDLPNVNAGGNDVNANAAVVADIPSNSDSNTNNSSLASDASGDVTLALNTTTSTSATGEIN